MKYFKKITILILFVLLFVLTGCDNNKPTKARLKKIIEVPHYEQEGDKFWIGAWNDPYPTLENYQALKEAHINYLFAWDNKTPNDFSNMISYAEANDVNVIYYTRGQTFDENIEKDMIMSKINSPNLAGFLYWDEPSEEKMIEFIPHSIDHNNKVQDKIFFINLLPGTYYVGNASYKDYLKNYINKILVNIEGRKILSVDLYPLGGLPDFKPYVQSNWLANLELTRELSEDFGLEVHYFINATKHHNYRRITEQTLRYEANVLMSYGVQGFTYFTYSNDKTVDFEVGIVSNDGTKSEKFDLVKKINSEIRKFERVYNAFDYQETMFVLGEGNNSNLNFKTTVNNVEEISYIKSVSATADTIVSSFKDGDDNYGVMFVNFSDPDLNITNYLDVYFHDATKALVYYRGEEMLIDLVDGKFSYDLTPGESVFVIPLNLV